MGVTTHAAMRKPRRPCRRTSTGTSRHCAANPPSPVWRIARPATSPPSITGMPADACVPSTPRDGANPRPPAPRRKGDQLCPAIANPPATAASLLRLLPASRGPTVALAMSAIPATANGPNPATSYNPVPETVPVPTSRRSTAARARAAMLELGMDPARNETASTFRRPIRCSLITGVYTPAWCGSLPRPPQPLRPLQSSRSVILPCGPGRDDRLSGQAVAGRQIASGFEQGLQLRQHSRPAAADHLHDLAVAVEELVHDGQLADTVDGFDLEADLGPLLRRDLGVVRLRQADALGPLGRERVPGVREAVIRVGFEHHLLGISDGDAEVLPRDR